MLVNNEFFPELDDLDFVCNDKYGILDVGLVKNPKVITGYQWNFKYYDTVDMKLKFFHSYDLRRLRLKVLENGFDWVITDNRKAISAYKLNNELMKKHDEYVRDYDYHGSSGVLYVTKQLDKRYRGEYTWRYYHDGRLCSNQSLKRLQDKVSEIGGVWIVKDEELYLKNITDEPFVK